MYFSYNLLEQRNTSFLLRRSDDFVRGLAKLALRNLAEESDIIKRDDGEERESVTK